MTWRVGSHKLYLLEMSRKRSLRSFPNICPGKYMELLLKYLSFFNFLFYQGNTGLDVYRWSDHQRLKNINSFHLLQVFKTKQIGTSANISRSEHLELPVCSICVSIARVHLNIKCFVFRGAELSLLGTLSWFYFLCGGNAEYFIRIPTLT